MARGAMPGVPGRQTNEPWTLAHGSLRDGSAAQPPGATP
jgi:hypothetical protein